MRLIRVSTASLLLLAAAFLTACQDSGEKSTRVSTTCPTCQTELTTTPLKGLSYRKHLCPECKRVTELSGEGDQKVHVCEKCRQIVEECEECKKEQ